MSDSVPHREVHGRRIRFSYPQGALRKHYVDGDLVMSHVVAVLSATFPPGEDVFVRSVRNFCDEISDPELKQQVAGFVGQEVTHGREHRELNRRLQEMGYPTHRVARFVKWSLADAEARPGGVRAPGGGVRCLPSGRRHGADADLGLPVRHSPFLERWTAELFGPEGTLADHLH
jgi:predicted metal-dependent hydrolase